MNKLFFIAICLAAFALAGCVATRIESVSVLSAYPTAQLYRGFRPKQQADKVVPVSKLTPILARATWVGGSVFSKGGDWLKYPNGSEVFIPTSFEFFRIKGVSGYFEIRPEDFTAYSAAVGEILRAGS